MTRENKVALVVGFALVLIVGVLISDHLSKAQTQRSADLVPASLAGRGGDDARVARFLDLRTAPASPVAPIRTWQAAPAAVPDADRPVRPGPPPAAATDATADRRHAVQPGESLSEIAHRFYGSVGFTDALAAYNGITDPDTLWAGKKLRIPAADVLAGPAQAADVAGPVVSAAPGPNPVAGTATYRVEPGDSLSSIAQRFMGSAGRWRRLYELNYDVISDPDTIKPGTVIELPAA